jgi:hypothetical protein
VAKAQAVALASESYTLGLASRVPLPTVAGGIVLGGVEEIREWLRVQWRVIGLTQENELALRDIATLQGIEAELRSNNAILLDELEQVRTALRRVHGSVSWRLTRPLRGLRRLKRR